MTQEEFKDIDSMLENAFEVKQARNGFRVIDRLSETETLFTFLYTYKWFSRLNKKHPAYHKMIQGQPWSEDPGQRRGIYSSEPILTSFARLNTSTCIISVGQIGSQDRKKREVARAVATCHPDDNPSKVIGRSLAFHEAMSRLTAQIYMVGNITNNPTEDYKGNALWEFTRRYVEKFIKEVFVQSNYNFLTVEQLQTTIYPQPREDDTSQ